MTRKILLRVLIGLGVLGLLLVIAGAGLYLSESDPMDDMRLRADALPIPKDFVLVAESYMPGGFGGAASLVRTYDAPWPGTCDSLQSLRNRSGKLLDLGHVAPEFADKICDFGAWYPVGWRSRIRGFRHYQLRLRATEPGLVREMGPQPPRGLFRIYPKPDQDATPMTVIPEGHAKIDVELIALHAMDPQ